MSNTKNKKILIIIGIIVAAVFIFSVAKRTIIEIMTKEARKMPPAVEMTAVTEDTIHDKMTSTGRIEAKYSVNVVARVQGWLKQSYFNEGDTVQKGALLFLIEPDNYQIAVNQASADLKKAQADYVNAEKDLKRSAELVKLDYVSKSYNDQALAKRDMAKAAVDMARASLANANLNLSYTRVHAPVTGKIGKILITQGNLVDASSGPITKIVSTTPIYAYFTVKSEDYLRFQKSIDKSLKDSIVTLILADGTEYANKGKVEFINNEVDPTVGTIGLRATFDNTDNVLVPSDYVNVVMTSSKPRHVVLIPQEAVQESKEGMLAYTVSKESVATPVIIKTDGQYNGNWIVTEGVKAGDQVISKGLLAVKPNIKVKIMEHKESANENKLDK